MFAFAIYVQCNRNEPEQLFIARDSEGKKPFYYTKTSNGFEFGSELKAINHSKIDYQALNHYLALGYVPFDFCIARDCKKLLPGFVGTYDLLSKNLKLWKYWDLPESAPFNEISGDELAEQSWELLKDSIRLRLRSDVPLGLFLSGGHDSSLITAATSEVSSQPIKTFTISTSGSNLDESAYAINC